jgi:polysaccharide pyruvyl transferase CsaB
VRKVLLLGYFGAGNFGDDALLCDWLARHREFLVQHELRADVVAHSERLIDGFIEQPQLVPLIDRVLTREAALRVDPREYTSLIAPGGSLLQDSTSLRSLLYYLWLIRKFTSARKAVYLLHQGLGPFHSFTARTVTPRVLRSCRYIACRDSDSFAWANARGRLAAHPELHDSADPILSGRLTVDPSAGEEWQLPNQYVLVLPKPTGDLPSPIDPTPEATALSQLLQAASQATGLPILLLPLHHARDAAFAEATASLVQGSRVLAPLPVTSANGTAIWSALARASLVISYRLHGVIAAAAHGVPALGVAYDPKVESCCESLGLPYCYPATVHEPIALADIGQLWAQRSEVTRAMLEQRAQLLAKLMSAEQRYEELWEQDCG